MKGKEKRCMKIENAKLNELKDSIKKIPISQIIESRLDDTSICPFHDDHHSGSFQFSDARGVFTCFSCGETGDGIEFVKKYDNVSFKESILRLSYEYGLISEQDYKDTSTEQTTKEVKVKKAEVAPKLKLAKKAPAWVINIVYLNVMDMCRLTPEHKEFLMGDDDSKNQRHMTEKEIHENFYFSMRPFSISQLIKRLDRYDLKEKDLLGVPGFYTKDNHVQAVFLNGIGIPLIDANGMVASIQVRRDEVEINPKTGKPGPRYIIWSSIKYENGCSCGSKVGIMEPHGELINKNIFITEGQFKANRLMRYFKASAITVQGVLNIDALKTELPKLIENHGGVDSIIVAYDADMFTNPNVRKACNKLKKLIDEVTMNQVDVKFLVWDEKYGKGCDDVINRGNQEHFMLISHERLEQSFERMKQKNKASS